MKITKSHLAKLIKEEMSKITKMRYAENKETGRWEEVAEGDEQQSPPRGSANGSASIAIGSAREDIENAINMLEEEDLEEDGSQGTLFYVIESLQDALAKL
jgi:hypothetical protein